MRSDMGDLLIASVSSRSKAISFFVILNMAPLDC
jgi:hypothetical protein